MQPQLATVFIKAAVGPTTAPHPRSGRAARLHPESVFDILRDRLRADDHNRTEVRDAIQIKLTDRERQVLLLYLETICDKQVAGRLGTRLQTVRNQLASVQRKVCVKSRAELVLRIIQAVISPRRILAGHG